MNLLYAKYMWSKKLFLMVTCNASGRWGEKLSYWEKKILKPAINSN